MTDETRQPEEKVSKPKQVRNLSPKYKKQRKLKKPVVSEVFNLFKKKSDTPLQTIERFITMNPKYSGVKMTYAGRLDPMAEGVLIVLAGEKNKERDAYTGLDKDYSFEFVLGVETDTYDVLGKIVSHAPVREVTLKEIQKAVKKYTGTFEQPYPAYSSKVIDGTPMFDLARQGKISEVVLPTHNVTVSKLEITGTRTMSREDFKKEIIKSVGFVKGDFRQEETIALWKEYLEGAAPETLTVYKGELSCGSGFYVRQLVSDLGRDLGTKAVTVGILRTRVGEYKLEK
ncbi:MAG: tRNA pseudouridine synthase tRNA pseudouridine55 synthase [Candidatus Parcubacteria bacterium]|jgi:tRNA pseudouridine55 synthase